MSNEKEDRYSILILNAKYLFFQQFAERVDRRATYFFVSVMQASTCDTKYHVNEIFSRIKYVEVDNNTINKCNTVYISAKYLLI